MPSRRWRLGEGLVAPAVRARRAPREEPSPGFGGGHAVAGRPAGVGALNPSRERLPTTPRSLYARMMNPRISALAPPVERTVKKGSPGDAENWMSCVRPRSVRRTVTP